jgi:hypothetical protein
MPVTISTTSLLIPRGTPLAPGKMYLRLYHGRTDPGQEMEDWGFEGNRPDGMDRRHRCAGLQIAAKVK